MKNRTLHLLIAFWLSTGYAFSQDSARYQLRLAVPVVDLPQNK
jgi:hypothetical protein